MQQRYALQEEKLTLATLPAPWVARFMQLFIYSSSNPEYKECPQCEKPYYWLLSSHAAWVCRSVCARWRYIFTMEQIIRPLQNEIKVCHSPFICLETYLAELKLRAEKARKIYIRVRKV